MGYPGKEEGQAHFRGASVGIDADELAQAIEVRTSSRVGYLDYGVNARRYNWFAKKLGGVKGWQTSSIKPKEHLEYFDLNELSEADVGL